MIPVYAICVVLGVIAGASWVFLGLTASAVAGKSHLEPEARFGETGRMTISGVLGFGLGGMSASFGGWGSALSLAGAAGGAVLAIAAARYLGYEQDSAEDLDKDHV
ncbi:MAG: hypothetical protein U9N84_06825 [Actinomycetota bacterium]|nr:hypothetical protein [Actinomycetota bacterium]